jgi:hypothetical protein
MTIEDVIESACAGTLLELKVQRLTAIIGLSANAALRF